MTNTYLSALNQKNLASIVEICTDRLAKHKNDFDYIAFSGISGALIAPIIAYQLQKNMIVVRKERSLHSELDVEGIEKNSTARYLVIDDFIDSGITILRILKKISRMSKKSSMVGVYLYNNCLLEKKQNEVIDILGLKNEFVIL